MSSAPFKSCSAHPWEESRGLGISLHLVYPRHLTSSCFQFDLALYYWVACVAGVNGEGGGGRGGEEEEEEEEEED